MIIKTVLINKPGNRESLEIALSILASNINADFSGDNGDEYLEDEARENGFSTNLDYYLNKYSKYENDYHFVEMIIFEMCHGSTSVFDVAYDDDGHVAAVSVCVDWD